jgi:hypothetical protein
MWGQGCLSFYSSVRGILFFRACAQKTSPTKGGIIYFPNADWLDRTVCEAENKFCDTAAKQGKLSLSGHPSNDVNRL